MGEPKDFPSHLRTDTLLQLWMGLAQFSMGFSFLAIIFVKEDSATNLMGGVVARVGDIVYDASVRGRLQQIRAEMAGRD